MGDAINIQTADQIQNNSINQLEELSQADIFHIEQNQQVEEYINEFRKEKIVNYFYDSLIPEVVNQAGDDHYQID